MCMLDDFCVHHLLISYFLYQEMNIRHEQECKMYRDYLAQACPHHYLVMQNLAIQVEKVRCLHTQLVQYVGSFIVGTLSGSFGMSNCAYPPYSCCTW
jgi:hypothetical protein